MNSQFLDIAGTLVNVEHIVAMNIRTHVWEGNTHRLDLHLRSRETPTFVWRGSEEKMERLYQRISAALKPTIV